MYRALASPARRRNITRAGNIYTSFLKRPNFSAKYKELLLFIDMFVGYAELFQCKSSIISAICFRCSSCKGKQKKGTSSYDDAKKFESFLVLSKIDQIATDKSHINRFSSKAVTGNP